MGRFFLIGWLVLGKGFAAKTFLGTALLPLFFLLTEGLPALTHNTLVGAIFGGLLVGLGLGIVFFRKCLNRWNGFDCNDTPSLRQNIFR